MIRLCALVFLVLSPLIAQAQDRVEYLDPTKNNQKVTKPGTIAGEDPGRLTLLTGVNQTRLEIPAGAVVEVVYEREPAEMFQVRGVERSKDKDPNKRLALYEAALKKSPEKEKYLLAHIRFKIAKLKAEQAGDDESSRAAAIDALRKFHKEFPDARQTVECLDLLTQLLIADGKPTQEVVTAFRQLKTKYGNKYKEIESRCDLFEGRLLLQEARSLLKQKPKEAKQKFTAARGRFAALLKGADAQAAAEIKIGLAECSAELGNHAEALKELDAVLTSATDFRTRAAAHLVRGDCHRARQQFREAIWEYLWVDVVYNEDREQQAKAVYCLIETFEGLKDDPVALGRAKECRDRLRTDERFQGTSYSKLVAESGSSDS